MSLKPKHTFSIVSLFLIFALATTGLFLPNRGFSIQTNAAEVSPRQTAGNSPVYFELNQGQHHKRVRFKAHGGDHTLFLTANEAVYVLRPNPKSATKSPSKQISDFKLNISVNEIKPPKATALYMSLVGANPDSDFYGLEEKITKLNYFRGNDETKWRSNVPTYQKVRMENVYQGIDTVWFGRSNGEVQYDFVVKPNAAPEQIEWLIEGAENVSINKKGELEIVTESGILRQKAPFSYQETNGFRQEVESSFVIKENPPSANGNPQTFRVGFNLGEYDRDQQLTIDPDVDLGNLQYSTYLGGLDGDDFGESIKVDNAGNVYVFGRTASTDFPVTPGSFDTTPNEFLGDAFVTKFNPSLSQLIYSTFIGGVEEEFAEDLEIDSLGNAYIMGRTDSPDYPTTSLAFDTTFNGANDIFVTKLNQTGSALDFSTFLGGSGDDFPGGIEIDADGNLIVAGRAGNGQMSFPTLNGFDTTHNGSFDGFVSRLAADGQTLMQSTFLGSSGFDTLEDVALDPVGNIYVTGIVPANGFNFPTTPGSFDTSLNGGRDIFLTKFNPTLSLLEYSTFIGGEGEEQSFAIDVDLNGNAYVSGRTESTDFPVTAGVIDTTLNGTGDGIVTKIDTLGENLIYSTLLGSNSNTDFLLSIVVDETGRAYVLADLRVPGYPTTPDAFDPVGQATTSNADVGLSRLNPTATALEYSTYVGGSQFDGASGMFVDAAGNVYITGHTNESSIRNYPVTAGAFDTSITNNINDKAFVSKFGGELQNSRRTVADFDGDGRTDQSVFRPAEGNWYLNQSFDGFAVINWGLAGDTLVPGDYDGDAKADPAVFRPSANLGENDFFILNSSDFTFTFVEWGLPGDIPLNGDYDGDQKTDIAVFRPSSGVWFILRSSDGSLVQESFGLNGDIPLVMDIEDDGKDNLAVFRPSDRTWYIARADGVPAQNFETIPFGIATDKPVPADYDDDGKTDVAVYRNGDWFILRSSDGGVSFIQFGTAADTPVPGDYDGDGQDDPAVYRDGTWFVTQSLEGVEIANFGLGTDKPIPAQYIP